MFCSEYVYDSFFVGSVYGRRILEISVHSNNQIGSYDVFLLKIIKDFFKTKLVRHRDALEFIFCL